MLLHAAELQSLHESRVIAHIGSDGRLQLLNFLERLARLPGRSRLPRPRRDRRSTVNLRTPGGRLDPRESLAFEPMSPMQIGRGCNHRGAECARRFRRARDQFRLAWHCERMGDRS